LKAEFDGPPVEYDTESVISMTSAATGFTSITTGSRTDEDLMYNSTDYSVFILSEVQRKPALVPLLPAHSTKLMDLVPWYHFAASSTSFCATS
jgi:hypothetical protein